jgi:hypothetical protein
MRRRRSAGARCKCRSWPQCSNSPAVLGRTSDHRSLGQAVATIVAVVRVCATGWELVNSSCVVNRGAVRCRLHGEEKRQAAWPNRVLVGFSSRCFWNRCRLGSKLNMHPHLASLCDQYNVCGMELVPFHASQLSRNAWYSRRFSATTALRVVHQNATYRPRASTSRHLHSSCLISSLRDFISSVGLKEVNHNPMVSLSVFCFKVCYNQRPRISLSPIFSTTCTVQQCCSVARLA